MPLYDYAGIIHLHSSYSFDGTTPLAKIIKDAQDQRLDFLLLTDHWTTRARDDGYEGWHQKTLLVVGEEISPRFNHLLAFGMDGPARHTGGESELSPQQQIDRVIGQNGLAFIAHPDHGGAALFHVKHYPWNDWSVKDFTGIGIWDFMTDWQNSLTGYLRAILSYAFPAHFLRGPSSATLARWDRMTRERRVAGIGELDNHNSRKRILGLPLSVFPFSRVFRLIRTHILTRRPFSGDSRSDIPLLLDSLRNGRAYVSLDHFTPADGFSFFAEDARNTATMGEELPFRDTAALRASFPAQARVRLIRNGALFHEEVARHLTIGIDDGGTYRIEADLSACGRFRPWIYSNPIYVTKR